MRRLSLADGAESFVTSLLEVPHPQGVVLFAVGGGGDPERHAPLLAALAGDGCAVVAPHFDRLASPFPTAQHLLMRARRLALALDAAAGANAPVVGVGHSIGAAVLLALAGAKMWLSREAPLPIAHDPRIARLALLAPATGFFQAPAALAEITTPLLVWAGENDTMTPPSQSTFLKTALAGQVAVDLRVAQGADHFSFMNVRPPHAPEPLADRETFLAQLTAEVCRFVTAT